MFFRPFDCARDQFVVLFRIVVTRRKCLAVLSYFYQVLLHKIVNILLEITSQINFAVRLRTTYIDELDIVGIGIIIASSNILIRKISRIL